MRRRDLLKFVGGAGLGALFTPVPWKLLDDVSIRTQDPWAAKPLRGAIGVRYTNCTLCSRACGIKARTVAGQPFQVIGISGHPAGRATLCPLGLAAHQLPFADDRVRSARIGNDVVPVDRALAFGASAMVGARGKVMFLDDTPGRCASEVYFEAARRSGSEYVTLEPVTVGSAVDYSSVRTLISFDAPVLHGWCTPAALLTRRSEYTLIQIEPEPTRTGAFADLRVTVPAALLNATALALAERIAAAKNIPLPTLVETREATPLSETQIAAFVTALTNDTPAAAIGNGSGVAALNFVLGAAIARKEPPFTLPAARPLDQVEDRSKLLVVADLNRGGVEWDRIERKLAPGGAVMALAAFEDAVTARAAAVVPAPALFESLTDVPGPDDSPRATWAVSTRLMNPPAGTIEPAEAVARIAGVDCSIEAAIARRAEALRKHGSLFRYRDAQVFPMSNVDDETFAELARGAACWVGEDPDAATVTIPSDAVCMRERPARRAPLVAKLDRESDLYRRTA
jgi:hypothetical protein